jgi:tRNA A37 methylthiotransferase MiaB
LFASVDEIQRAHLQSMVGKRMQVLVESRDESVPNRYAGRSERFELVHLEAPEGVDPRGALVDVEIVEAFKHSLHGMMEGGVYRAPAPKRAPLRLPMASA